MAHAVYFFKTSGKAVREPRNLLQQIVLQVSRSNDSPSAPHGSKTNPRQVTRLNKPEQAALVGHSLLRRPPLHLDLFVLRVSKGYLWD